MRFRISPYHCEDFWNWLWSLPIEERLRIGIVLGQNERLRHCRVKVTKIA